MPWIIEKATREGEGSYGGPTCMWAGVKPFKLYDSKVEAQIDANKLNDNNPVGFNVICVKE